MTQDGRIQRTAATGRHSQRVARTTKEETDQQRKDGEAVKPQRIQLKRTKGFNLQAVSIALNGLPAVKCARPAKYSNPFRIGEYEYDNGTFTLSRGQAKEEFRRWLRTEPEGRRLAREAVKELRGKNLACFCAIGCPCHCDVLLELANKEGK